jgi:hypothetical protein
VAAMLCFVFLPAANRDVDHRRSAELGGAFCVFG